MVSNVILVTGARGQLGTELVASLSKKYPVIGIDIADCDITNPQHVWETIGVHAPEVVIHTAAITDVDRCESEPDLAMRVNGQAPGFIARSCREVGARLIYYSTDYVFDGARRTPYTESDIPNPQTVYGRSKLEGERQIRHILNDCCILRLAWVYSSHGNNFVKTMVRLGREQLQATQRGEAPPIRVVNDQIGNPTWTCDIVRQTEDILAKPMNGLFHCTAEGETSWYDCAVRVFSVLGMPVKLEPCTTAQFPRLAPRPAYSSLENAALKRRGRNVMRDWRESLDEFLASQKEELFYAV